MAETNKRKRRVNGAGSIMQRKDGRWMGRYYVTLPDGTKKRQQIISKDQQTVVEKLREEMVMADRGTPVFRDNRTVGEYLEYWLTNISAPRVRPNTQEVRAGAVRRDVIAQIGHYQLYALKPMHVNQMIMQLRAKGKSSHTQKRAKQLLSSALKDAVRMEIVNRNVAELVDTPKHVYKERNVWSMAQVQQFLNYTKSVSHRYYPLFELLFYYGMRRGEVLGLRWQDIDFDRGSISIRQTLAEVNHKPVFNKPKTRASERDLPLIPKIQETLALYLLTSPKYGDDLLFHSEWGNPVDPRSLLDSFNLLSKKAGLPRICLHEIRHTVATMLKDSGVTPKDAQVILGHSDITTTLQIYTHSSHENKLDAMNALAGSLNI